ncbi:MAG TPA: imidazolonepropionase [Terriglobia bacterium]|nr:imidazolonepropionase [Terriglobia bacterium]
MSRRTLIGPCSQLLTLAGSSRPRHGVEQGELEIINEGGILIEDDTIKWVGLFRDLPPIAAEAPTERIFARECVVMPGFVDSHAHPVFVKSRAQEYELRIQGKSYPEIAAMGGGILTSVADVRNASLEQLVEVSQARIPRFLEHGTTTLEAKTGYGLDLVNEIKMLEAIRRLQATTSLELVPTFLGAHEIPPEYKFHKAEYVRLLIERIIPEVSKRGLAEFCDCFVEPGIFELDQAEEILRTAKFHGLQLKLHADQLSRSGATLLGVKLGAVSIDHLEQIASQEIHALAESPSVATLLPGSVFHLGAEPYPPARALIEAGVPVALATDFNPGSSPTVSMQMILSLACTQMRMTPAEAIVAGTINAAHALSRDSRIGSLEEGKQADLCIMAVADYREIPYWFGMNHCTMTIKKGRVVYQKPP